MIKKSTNDKPLFEETKAFAMAKWIHNYPGLPWMTISALGLAGAGYLTNIWFQLIAYGVSAYLFVRGSILSKQEADTLVSLESELSLLRESNGDRSTELLSLIRIQLTEIVRKFAKEARFDHHDRITIYLVTRDRTTFVAVARHSDNPNYSGIVRDSYPVNQGIISKAWSDGRAEFQHGVDESSDRYCERLKEEFDIPLGVARKIRMKSVCLAAGQLENTHSEPKAVVVVETLVHDMARITTVVDTISKQALPIVTTLEVLQSLSSSPQEVAEEGF